MPWAHAIGVYLLGGTISMGLGLVVRAGWIRLGKMKPIPAGNPYRKIPFFVGIALGFLLWPLFLLGLTIAWKFNKNRRVEEYLGYCEHANSLDPICPACSMDIERRKKVVFKRVTDEPEFIGGEDLGKSSGRLPLARITKSYYVCSVCKIEYEGFPHGSDADGRLLCPACKDKGGKLKG